MTIFKLYQIISCIEFVFGLSYIYLQNNHVITLYWIFGITVANFIIMILITIYKDLDKLMVESEKH